MGNLTKNTMARGAVVVLALSAGVATTANAAVTRTAGADRYSTATEIFKTWPTATDTAILAAGVGHDVDALTVAPLAKMKNAPVILVDTTTKTADILAKFEAFNTVYIANGVGVISPAIETALKATGKTVVRLGGATRTETALNIAKKIGSANDIVIANGDDSHLVDTLSIASIAAAKGMPIFLTSGGALSDAEATYAKGLGATNVYALGGTTVVSDASVVGLGKVTRLSGPGRYETNAKIVNQFKDNLDLKNIYVASGEDENLIDALAGAPLAGLKSAPIVFAHDSINSDVSILLNNAIDAATNLTILGGVGAVSETVKASITAIQNGQANLSVASVGISNSKTLVVKFTQPVLNTTVLDTTTGKAKNISVTAVDSAAPITNSNVAAVLSSDGLTLTLTPSAAEYFKGKYALTISTAVTDKSANPITAYSSIFTASDTTRPNVVSVTYPVNGKAHFTFSEPVNFANITAMMFVSDPDGNVITTPSIVVATDNLSLDLNIAAFTTDSNYTVTLVGLADFAGNLMSPNPTALIVKNSIVDRSTPTVLSVVPISLTSMKVTFSEPLKSTWGVIGKYKIDGWGLTNIDTTPINGNATLDATGTIATITKIISVTGGLHNVAISDFNDLSGNPGVETSKLTTFTADTIAPTCVSSQVLAIDNDIYLVVKYSENVQPNLMSTALSGTYVDGSSITKAFPTVTGSTSNVSVYDPSTVGVTDSIKIKLTSLPAGNYTAVINAGLVRDMSYLPSAARVVNFSLGSFVDSVVPQITSVGVQASEDVVTVAFDRDVTAATALNLENYKVEGANIFSSAIFDGDARTVKLTLIPNTITVTGGRQLTINNIATAAGKVMAPYSAVKTFYENVKPTLVSATFKDATTITATFSEAVTGFITSDYEFYINGVKQTPAVYNVGVTRSRTVSITIPAITDLNKVYAIKYIGSDLKDVGNNSAVASGIITVTH